MNKVTEAINEALSKLVKPEDLKDVTSVLESLIDNAKTDLEKDYDAKLQEAYKELSTEMKEAETTAEKGYGEAFGVIQDLRNRLETQRAEFDSALEEGYEEAYQMLLAERGKKDSVETEMYDEYDKKLKEMKEYMFDKVDEFLQVKGKDIYEQARRDVMNDPRLAERAVTLNKVVETVADYISDEDYSRTNNAKMQENIKALDELKGQVRLLEARNIRISTENNKLTEQVRQGQEVLKEHANSAATDDKKARKEAAKNAAGRGSTATGDTVVLGESTDKVVEANKGDGKDNTLVESMSPDEWATMKTLSGIPTPDKK
jgi:hypothetical protein